MANATTMTYGGYEFKPVPLITIEKTPRYTKTGIAEFQFKVTLTGVLTPIDPDIPGDEDTGIVVTFGLLNELSDSLMNECATFIISCEGSGGPEELLNVEAKLESVNFDQSTDNWVQTIPYTIVLSYTEPGTVPEEQYIESYSDTWELEFLQESKPFADSLSVPAQNQDGGSNYGDDSNNTFEVRITHSINVQGNRSFCDGEGGTSTAIENATTFFDTLGYGTYDADKASPPFLNILDSGGTTTIYDHYKSHTTDELNGTIDARETWLVVGDNPNYGVKGFREDFTVTHVKTITDAKHKITVEGSIQGFESITYPYTVTTSAFSNASSAWGEIEGRLYPRAQNLFYSLGLPANISGLNIIPVSSNLAKSNSKGIITYTYEYDNRPCSIIEDSISEELTIIDNHPTDVFASLPVIGRPQGPILQAINTFTSPTREISFDVVMPPPSDCVYGTLDEFKPSDEVEAFLCNYENELIAQVGTGQVFKTADTENWSPLSGRYNRSISWIYSSCGGGLESSIC